MSRSLKKMIQVEHQKIRDTAPGDPIYDYFTIQSEKYIFCRLKSENGIAAKLFFPDLPIDYIASLNINTIQRHFIQHGEIIKECDSLAEQRISVISGTTATALVIDHPFDLLWFCRRKMKRTNAAPLPESFGLDDPIACGLMYSLMAMMEHADTSSPLLLRHVGDAMDTHIRSVRGQGYLQRKKLLGSLSPWQLDLAKTMLIDSIAKDLPISEVAERCGLSSGYFSTAFKHATGQSPLNWLHEYRIEKAKNLLLTSDLPLSQVAKLCAFFDQAYFNRLFSRMVGMPPGKWRLHQRFVVAGLAAVA